jgi:iron complex outermembrane receptor protein
MTFSTNVSARALFKAATLSTVSIAALLIAGGANAQIVNAPAQSAQGPNVEEIVVTGSRIVRDGYEAPTPVSVLSEETIQAAAPENIADFVNKLPSVVGSATPLTSNLSFSNGQAGLNTLNLRGLGASRTLVLLDGQRSVPSTIDGLVDVNDFPQQLISRVDVVTGGASAAYGSDALSGVVNFVLDKKFSGIKGEVSGGVTTYGDDRNWKVALTGGTDFANGRGHFLISGELSDKDGIYGVPRAWNNNGWVILNNPAYGTNTAAGQSTTVPQRILTSGAGLSQATPGGIITTAGALKGIAFGPGGTPYQFNYGSLIGDPFMVGGDWRSTQVNQYNTLDQAVVRQGVFSRFSYQVTDDVEVYVQGQWGHARANGWALKQFNINNIVIKGDNAFIPASVAATIAANKISQFTLGSMNVDQPTITFDNGRTVNRYVVGANGRFDAADTAWNWDAYYQKGVPAPRKTASTSAARLISPTPSTRCADPTAISSAVRPSPTRPTAACPGTPWASASTARRRSTTSSLRPATRSATSASSRTWPPPPCAASPSATGPARCRWRSVSNTVAKPSVAVPIPSRWPTAGSPVTTCRRSAPTT